MHNVKACIHNHAYKDKCDETKLFEA